MRSLAYDRAQGILLSAGFEFAIRAWALIGSASYPLFTLVGHQLPVRALCAVPGHARMVSVDEGGKLFWWDTRRDAALDAHERAIDTFRVAGDGEAELVGAVFGVDGARAFSENEVSLCVAGKRLHVFDAVDTRPPEPPPVAAVFTAATNSILTAHGRSVKV